MQSIRCDPNNTHLRLEVLKGPQIVDDEVTAALLGQGEISLSQARNIWMFRPWLELCLFSRIGVDVTDYLTVIRFVLIKDGQSVWCEYVADLFRYEAAFRPGANVNLHRFREGSQMAGAWSIDIGASFLPPMAWETLGQQNQHLVFDQIPFAPLAQTKWNIVEPTELTPTGERIRPVDTSVFSDRVVSPDEI